MKVQIPNLSPELENWFLDLENMNLFFHVFPKMRKMGYSIDQINEILRDLPEEYGYVDIYVNGDLVVHDEYMKEVLYRRSLLKDL